MHVLNLPCILPPPDRIVVELIPEGYGGERSTGESRERVEVEPVDNETERVGDKK